MMDAAPEQRSRPSSQTALLQGTDVQGSDVRGSDMQQSPMRRTPRESPQAQDVLGPARRWRSVDAAAEPPESSESAWEDSGSDASDNTGSRNKDARSRRSRRSVKKPRASPAPAVQSVPAVAVAEAPARRARGAAARGRRPQFNIRRASTAPDAPELRECGTEGNSCLVCGGVRHGDHAHCQSCYSALWKDARRVVEVCARRLSRNWFTGNPVTDLATFQTGYACAMYSCVMFTLDVMLHRDFLHQHFFHQLPPLSAHSPFPCMR